MPAAVAPPYSPARPRPRVWALDPGLLVVLLLATLAAWPLLTRASLVTLTDAHQHALRTYELMQGWRSGVPYPRWAPDFYYGFGYPVFNYYAVLTYYLAGAYGLLFGPVAGIKLVLVLAAYVGPVGVYWFSRDRLGGTAAVVSAAVYAFAPYIALVNPLMRGAAPEALATAIAPLVFWTWTRLAQPGGRGFFLPAALSLAALLLAHNMMPFVYLALLAAWLLWDNLLGERRTSVAEALRRAIPLGAAGLLALGLTAFMWLPAALERNAVQYANAFGEVLARRFVTWPELFAPMTRTDMEPFGIADYVYRLGLLQWVFALAGALTLLRSAPQRRTTLFWALVAAACLLVMVPQATWLWEHFAPLQYLQFSFRLLGVVALALALLAGAAVAWAGRRVSAAAMAAGLVAVTLGFGLRLLNPLPWPAFPAITPQAIMAFEVGGLWGVGTTWQGEFLPVGVRARPQPHPAVQAAVAAGTVEKIDRAALPAGATVDLAEHTAQRDTFTTNAPEGFTVRLITFYWPGWTAYVDGEATPITVTDPEGWIAVAVPAGAHTVTVQLEDTAPRRLGWLVSGGALVVLAGYAMIVVRQRRPAPAPMRSTRLLTAPAALLAVVVAAGLVTRYGLDAGLRWQAAQSPAAVTYDNQMALVAYDLPQTSARPGDAVPLTFYWLMRGPTEAPASVFVHFYGPDGKLWGQSDKPDPIVFFPTTRWPLGRALTDAHSAQLQPDAPPGIYRVAVGLWDRATGRRSHPLDANGQPLEADVFTLTDSFVVAP